MVLGSANSPVEEESLCSTLIVEMKRMFGSDQRRIRHALGVLDFSERILDRTTADPLVVKAAAILHDIGIHEAEKKYGSAAGKYQQIEGPPIARGILQSAGMDAERMEHVCDIIADHHSAKSMDSEEFRVIWDADRLVNEFVETPEKSTKNFERLIPKVFKTSAGQELAHHQLACRRITRQS